MLKYEAKLIDPGADEVVATLTKATAAANKRCRARLLTGVPARWRKFARDAAARPEGYAMFRGGKGGIPATQVLAAWWTDAIGRKHVAVRGRRIEHDGARQFLQPDALDTRPPLWHAYPEYVCRRTTAGGSQLVCACGCGAVGTPEALGWMGETCGPCFDRKQEHGAAGLRANLPGVLYGDREPLGALACSPDGSRVAAVEGDTSVTYWDIPRRTRTMMTFGGVQVLDVAITADGRHLLAVGVGALAPGGLGATFDLTTDPIARIDANPGRATDPPGRCVAALPDPGRVLAQRLTFATRTYRVEEIEVAAGTVGRGFDLPPGVERFAVSPDGRRLATGGSRVLVYDLDTFEPVGEVDGYHPAVAFAPDGERLFGLHFRAVRAHDLAGRTHGAKAAPWASPNEIPRALAVDPAGAFVYAGTSLGSVYALTAAALQSRAAFEWHLGAVRGLALSADGSRLFSSGADGCVKVWPIRDLMKGV